MKRRKAKPVPFRHLDGRIDTFDPEGCQRFGPGRDGGGDPDAPAVIPEAPEFTVAGRPGRYFGWTCWGRDPGMTARSAAMPTRERAAEDLREAIRELRRVMMAGGDPPGAGDGPRP